MNRFVKEFFRRGMLFAWGGPAVVAIVWLILGKTGQLEALRTGEAALGVLSSTVLAFVAAGITTVYQLAQAHGRADPPGGAVCRLSDGLSAERMDRPPGHRGLYAGLRRRVPAHLGSGVSGGFPQC